jgi:hypothetical protein
MDNMSKYYDGMSEALDNIELMDKSDLLDYIDGLYGRDRLGGDFSNGELKEEARRQVRLDYTKPMTESDKADQAYYAAIVKSIRR